jgi:nucleoside 2-deoxyribosyltransferase
MRVLLSYPFTGEDVAAVEAMLQSACAGLRSAGIEPVNLAAEQQEPRAAMNEAFRLMGMVDMLLVLQLSERRSEGMLMEVGYALARGLPVVAVTQDDVQRTYLPSMATVALRWQSLVDLRAKLAALDTANIVAKRETATRSAAR